MTSSSNGVALSRKAFTLIELLVVITIIAILAAILFPVFAQSKAAAKKIASLSNNKQTNLAVMMYAGDSDDSFPPVVAWGGSNPPAYYGGAPYCPWNWITLPYIKSAKVFLDPQAPPNLPYPVGFPSDADNYLDPQYGYNYQGLSPLTLSQDGSTWSMAPVTSSSLERPAETVALAAKFSQGETNQLADEYYWASTGSWTTPVTVETPFCSASPFVGCFSSWGTGNTVDAALGLSPSAGLVTGGVSLRAGNQAVLSWADGHASAKNAGYLARGTNWNPSLDSYSVAVTDPTLYLWGTYRP